MKINKSLLIVCIVETIIIICLAIYLIFYKSKPIKIPQEPQVIELVRDSIIRDSIYINNEVIKTEIKYIKEQFKQDSIDIMSANDSMLYSTFTDYINNYNNRFFNHNNK